MKLLSSFFLCGALAIDSTLLMFLMQQNSVSNPNQANQMNQMLPLLLLDDDDSSDNTDMLIMMMMNGQNMGDMNALLPFLLLSDDSSDDSGGHSGPVVDVTCDEYAYDLVDTELCLNPEDYSGSNTTRVTVRCPENCAEGVLWGSDVYTGDSRICTAAAHMGLTTLASGGVVELTTAECPTCPPNSDQCYEATTRNGITSTNYEEYEYAYTLRAVGGKSMDFKSLFLLTNMMNQDCEHETDSMMNQLMPLLMMGDEGSSTDDLMMMMMFQSMGNSPIDMSQMMPFMLMNDQSEDDSLLMMVMLSSMTGGMNTQQGFDNNFNMMLPMLLSDCDDSDDDCKKKQKNMMIMMMAMQSQSPNTQMGPNTMLPLLLMDDDSDNENLMFYMMMSQNKPAC